MQKQDIFILLLFLMVTAVVAYYAYIGGSTTLCAKLGGKLVAGENDNMFSPSCLVEDGGDLTTLRCCKCQDKYIRLPEFKINVTKN